MINTDALIEYFGDDVDCVKQIFGLYLEHNVPVINSIEGFYAKNDTDALMRAFHTLSGSLSNLQEQEVAIVQDCEKIAKRGELPSQEQMDLFYEKLGETTRQIEAFVK